MRFINPSHPAGRLEYIAILMLAYLGGWALLRYGLDIQVDVASQDVSYKNGNLPWVICGGAVLWIFQMITMRRRMFDIHMGSGFLAMMAIPFLGQFLQLFLLVSSGISRSTKAPYGEDPNNPESWVQKPTPGTSTGPAVTFRGEALTLPGEDSWGNSDAA